MHAYNASVQMSYSDEQTCIEKCLASSVCVSADYNSGAATGHRCYFHTSTTATGCPSTLIVNTAINHYNSMRCTSKHERL